VSKAKYQVRVVETPDGNGYVATAVLTFSNGQTISAEAHVDVREIYKTLVAAKHGVSGEFEVGGFFGSLWKGAKDVGKKLAKSKALGVVAKVIKNPVVTGVISVIPVLGPEVAIGLNVAGTAYTALQAKALHSKGKHKAARALLAGSLQGAKAAGVPIEDWRKAARYGVSLGVTHAQYAAARRVAKRHLAARNALQGHCAC